MNDISFLWYTSKDSKTTSLATCGTSFGHKQGTSKHDSDGDVEDPEDAGLWSLPVAHFLKADSCAGVNWVESEKKTLKTTTCLVGFLNWIHPQFSRLPAYGHLSKPSRRRMVYQRPKLIQNETKSDFYKHRRASNSQDFFWSGHRSVQLFNQDFTVHGDASAKSIPARRLLVVRGLIVWPLTRCWCPEAKLVNLFECSGALKRQGKWDKVGNEQIRVPIPFFFPMPSWRYGVRMTGIFDTCTK